MKKFISLTTLLILTRYADAQTTYLNTPNLKLEANPLVSVFGLGWTGLIFTQMILLAFITYALWVYCFKTVTLPTFDKGTSLKQFISIFYFRDTKSFYKLFYKLPTNKNSLLYSFGYVLTYSLIFMSIVISSSTSLLITNKNYRHFYSSYHIQTCLYLLGIISVIFCFIKFYKKELLFRTAY